MGQSETVDNSVVGIQNRTSKGKSNLSYFVYVVTKSCLQNDEMKLQISEFRNIVCSESGLPRSEVPRPSLLTLTMGSGTILLASLSSFFR